jgi:hypothetical protein
MFSNTISPIVNSIVPRCLDGFLLLLVLKIPTNTLNLVPESNEVEGS